MAVYQEKAEAVKKIVESVRSLETLKITLPLGNPSLRFVHTNQFLFTELPEDFFKLANMDEISKALDSTYSRNSGYQLNRWYIEGLTITNDKSSFNMELELNPFASTLNKYHDDEVSFEKAFKDAQPKTTNTNKSNVKSTSTGVKLKDVKGFSKSDNEYIKKVVRKALKKRNNPTNPILIAYAIFEYYRDNHVYSKYDCMVKMRAGGFEKTWKADRHNCGDGASTLVAMFRCAGLDADIMHKPGHFYVRLKINGEKYYCDQSGASGAHNNKTLGKKGDNNNVWGGISSSASVVGFKFC